MKLKLMSLLAFFMAVPQLGEASNITIGTEFKNVRQKFKLKSEDDLRLEESVKGKFGLVDVFLGVGPEIGLADDYLLGVGWKTDVFYDKSRMNINDTAPCDNEDYSTKNEGADFDELYLKFGRDFSPNWRGSLLFNYTQYSQNRSPTENRSGIYLQYEDKSYGLEGRIEYSATTASRRFEYGAGVGILVENGKTREDLFETALLNGAALQQKFSYWNIGGSVDAFAGYNITDRINARVSYKFKYSTDISIGSEKLTTTKGDHTVKEDVGFSGNQKIDNSFRVNLSYRF